jgi:hypothetical protein
MTSHPKTYDDAEEDLVVNDDGYDLLRDAVPADADPPEFDTAEDEDEASESLRDYLAHPDDLADVTAALLGPLTPAEAAAPQILIMFGAHAGARHPDGVTPITFGMVADAAAWACATGMIRRALMRDPVTSFTAPAVVLLRP